MTRRLLAAGLVLLFACGGKIENTGSLHSNVAAMPPESTVGGGGRGAGSIPLEGQLEVMAADATHFYVAGVTATILKVPKAGGAPEAFDAGDTFVDGLAVDDTYVYWTRLVNNQVVRMPKTGGPVEVLATDQHRPWGIAVDDQRVYWACQGDQGPNTPWPPPNGRILSLAKSGGPVQVLADAPDAGTVMLDGAYVYYDDDKGIARVPRTGGTAERLVEEAGAGGPVIAGGWLGWTLFDRFVQVPLASKSPRLEVVPTPNQAVIGALATDGQTFYFGRWTEGGGEMLAVDAGSSTSRTFAPDTVPPDATHFIGESVLVDDSHVYWLDSWWSYKAPKTQSAIRSAPR